MWARQGGGRAHEVGPIFGQCAGEFARESFFGLKCPQNVLMIKVVVKNANMSRTPSVSKLTHMIIPCCDLVGSHHDKWKADC